MLKMNCKVGDIISVSDDFFLEVIDTSKNNVTFRVNGLERMDLTVSLAGSGEQKFQPTRREMVA